MHCERNILLERGLFCPFCEKKTRGLGNLPCQEKIKQKWSEKLKTRFLNHFHHGGHPGTGPEREVHQLSSLASTAPLSHVVTQKMIIALSSACAESRWQCEVDQARRVQLIELAECGRYPAQFSYLPSVTGHTWCENAPPPPPQFLKKWGWSILVGSRRLCHLVLILGRRADNHMIFHIFSYIFIKDFS